MTCNTSIASCMTGLPPVFEYAQEHVTFESFSIRHHNEKDMTKDFSHVGYLEKWNNLPAGKNYYSYSWLRNKNVDRSISQ